MKFSPWIITIFVSIVIAASPSRAQRSGYAMQREVEQYWIGRSQAALGILCNATEEGLVNREAANRLAGLEIKDVEYYEENYQVPGLVKLYIKFLVECGV